MAASFNPDLDADNDGVNDFIEIARDGVNADIKREELQLQRDKLSQQTITDNKKLELEEKKSANKNLDLLAEVCAIAAQHINTREKLSPHVYSIQKFFY